MIVVFRKRNEEIINVKENCKIPEHSDIMVFGNQEYSCVGVMYRKHPKTAELIADVYFDNEN